MSASDQDPSPEEKIVTVERTSGGGIIAAVALGLAIAALLHHFGLLPF